MNEPEKRQISVTITDVDDLRNVYAALDMLFRTMLSHYAEKDDAESCDRVVGGCYLYFKRILEAAGYSPNDINEIKE